MPTEAGGVAVVIAEARVFAEDECEIRVVQTGSAATAPCPRTLLRGNLSESLRGGHWNIKEIAAHLTSSATHYTRRGTGSNQAGLVL